jgi:peptidoglycan/LPS O-acetylase OafA/YrhL
MVERHPRLDSLTGLRFFAAYLVLEHHFTNFAALPKLTRYTDLGVSGVTFFFVLSGFVLTWSFVPGDTAPRFYWRRFARIWPMHFVATLLALPVFYTWRDIPMDWTGIILSIFLLHAWVPTASTYFAGNPASWSLSCEMFFYALHPLFVRRTLALGALLLAAAAAATMLAMYLVADWTVAWLPGRIGGWLLYVAPVYRVGEFVLGVLLAAALRRGIRLPIGLIPAVILLGGWFLFFYNGGPHLPAWWQVFVSEVNYALLPALYGLVIAGAAQLDLADSPSPLRSRVMITLGQWSYALYLTHATIIYALIHWLDPRSFSYLNYGWLVVVSALCIGASGLFYQFIEHPLENWLRGLIRRPVAPAQAAPAPS